MIKSIPDISERWVLKQFTAQSESRSNATFGIIGAQKFHVSDMKTGKILRARTASYLFSLSQALSQSLAQSGPTESIQTTLSNFLS